MRVLVDTSVWVSHFRSADPQLTALLLNDRVLCHPMIIGEIACGTPPAPRANTLQYLSTLAPVTVASFDEVLFVIEQNQLFGKGCGYIDLALLASALLTPDTCLWTKDKSLNSLAKQQQIAFSD